MPLKPDKITTIKFKSSTLTIKEKIIPSTARSTKDIAEWCKKGQPMKPNRPLATDGRARGIVVHNTPAIKVKNTTMAEQYTRATSPNCNMGGVVVHFYASPQEAWQNLELTEQGWHATDGSARTRGHVDASYSTLGGNLDCIAVEIPGKESEDTGAKLVAYLLYKTGLTIKDVYTHNYFISSAVYGMYPTDGYIENSYKNCPIYILDHWEAFLKKVEGYLSELRPSSTPSVSPEPENTPNEGKAESYLYKVQIGAFGVKANAEKYKEEAVKAGFSNSYITSTKSKGKTLYRVQVGAFSSLTNAQSYAKKAKNKGFDVIIIKTIK